MIIVGLLLIISLRGKSEEKLINDWRLYRKYIIVFLILITLVVVYYSINIVIKNVEQANYLEKEKLLQDHINKPYWTINNLIITNEKLWSSEDYLHKGYRRLTELNFILKNNSPIDIFNLSFDFLVYTDKGEFEIVKSFSVLVDISAHSQKNIEYVFGPNDFGPIPPDFTWLMYKIKAKPSISFIQSKTLKEIRDYTISDSSSLKSTIGPNDIDWEKLNRELQDSVSDEEKQ